MSAIRSRISVNRTWRGLPISVAIDPNGHVLAGTKFATR
jgi:hypothetical protein